MRDLAVYYCQTCGRYAYFQLPKNAICHRCHKDMLLIELSYPEFMDLNHEERDSLISRLIIEHASSYVHRLCAPNKLFNQREVIGRLTAEVTQLQDENRKLNDTIEWMHQTIWDQLAKTRQLEREIQKVQEMT